MTVQDRYVEDSTIFNKFVKSKEDIFNKYNNQLANNKKTIFR